MSSMSVSLTTTASHAPATRHLPPPNMEPRRGIRRTTASTRSAANAQHQVAPAVWPTQNIDAMFYRRVARALLGALTTAGLMAAPPLLVACWVVPFSWAPLVFYGALMLGLGSGIVIFSLLVRRDPRDAHLEKTRYFLADVAREYQLSNRTRREQIAQELRSTVLAFRQHRPQSASEIINKIHELTS